MAPALKLFSPALPPNALDKAVLIIAVASLPSGGSVLKTILIDSDDILKIMPSGRGKSTLQTRLTRCVRQVELSATRFAKCD